MSAEHRNILPEEDQLRLASVLQTADLLGIIQSPDPADWLELKSGRISPHYMDVRKGISSFETRQEIAHSLLHLAERRADSLPAGNIDEAYNHIAGTPEAMTSYAASIADLGGLSLLQPRVALDKVSGNKAPILGRFEEGDSVAAFDDVVTDGKSKIDVIRALNGAGLKVADYFVLLDREEGGTPAVAEEIDVDIVPALGVSSLVRLLKAERKITAQQFDNVVRYLEEYGERHALETISTPL